MNRENGISSGHLRRGLLLQEQGRYGEAESYFREALAQNPHDAVAFHHLAICQVQFPERREEALRTIGEALALEPDEAVHHSVKAYILCSLLRLAEALRAAEAGIEIAPDSPFSFIAEAQVFLSMERWPEAEHAARLALALDADNATAANQLAQALRLQNKMEENAAQIAGMLARDPENAHTHASAGWSALQRGERLVAERHFLEALRLDPECETARDGLLQSFRARSFLYRAYLKYCFAIARLSKGKRWALVLGLYLGAKFSGVFLTGRCAALGIGIGLVYVLFVFWVWVARGVGNSILLFDRFAKHALRRGEKLEGLTVGGTLVAGIGFLITGFAVGSGSLLIPGFLFCASAIPFGLTFTNESRAGRWVFGGIGGFAVLTGVIAIFGAAGLVPNGVTGALFGIALVSAFLTTWLGNISSLRRG